MKFNPDAILHDAMRDAKRNMLASARYLIGHYRLMVDLGADRAIRPRYLKTVYQSDTEMIAAIEKIIAKKIERNS